MELRRNYVVNCVGHIAPVNLVKGLTRLTKPIAACAISYANPMVYYYFTTI